MKFKGIRLWALGLGVAFSVIPLFGSPDISIKKINLPRVPASAFSQSTLPRRDAPLRIAALRVEFVRDTLSTTTGSGGFDYSYNDSNYFDPPPHDSLYFADHLEFQNFYWFKMSGGNLSFEWDVFPAGDRAAYQLPKQMWQYNYNNGAEQLDSGLVNLFHDAIVSADADPAIVWTDYDLVIIFHAGAGAEFDLGYTTTPHDLPSAWMVPEDFRSHGYPDGIPVDNGYISVNRGLILPETETHEGVQISMAGVISLMIGHWLGLPALYDKDDGKPVVGKWSMMDRGFGNFYGALPGPVDAWSAGKMGWLDIEEATIGANGLQDRLHDYAVLPEDPVYPGALRIPVSSQEEFILECRYRDPENDSVAYAWDREGRRMTFHDDYSVTVEPGFRVPVRADDLDYDSPGSGILIWHHDGGLDRLINEGRFNSVNEIRGLDLEEADGAQDIGREYSLLTPGYGTDYGIYEDAWYGDNDGYKNANQGRLVSFNNDSYPNSRSNSGAYTHVKVDSLSRRGWQMGFRYRNEFQLFSIPIQLHDGEFYLISGNFERDIDTTEFVVITADSALFFRIDGKLIQQLNWDGTIPEFPLVRDLNGDKLDEIVWFDHQLNSIESTPFGNFAHRVVLNDIRGGLTAFGSAGMSSIFVCASQSRGYLFNESLQLESEVDFTEPEIALHRYGSVISDSFIVATYDGKVFLWTRGGIRLVEELDILPNWFIEATHLADFDANGTQDIVMICGSLPPVQRQINFILISDLLESSNSDRITASTNPNVNTFKNSIPVDINRDGRYEILGVSRNDFMAINLNGTIVDGFPWNGKAGSPDPSWSNYFIGDILGDGRPEVILSPASNQTDAMNNIGKSLPGFPVVSIGVAPLIVQSGDSGMVVIIPFSDRLQATFINRTGNRTPSIWWQGPYRDNDHSNAIWEPATPFSPASTSDLFIENQCYNWPNPARGESTAIRYTLNYPASVTVEIYDVAGDKVASLSGVGEAGLPNEIIWDVRNVARGAYLAVVEANGNGMSDRKTVKIAVVK